MQTPPQPLSQTAKLFGYAGLLPQAFAVLTLIEGKELLWIATAGGYAYAALIFSFLGGLWWAIAILNRTAQDWIYAAAIAPSLIALATFLPWTWGWEWPQPSLIILAVCLIASPVIDYRIAEIVALPEGWLRLRLILSIGLGVLTAILAIASA
jgi:hypothetical protein